MEKQPDILIIGGGVIGVCSAYYLARRGHKVTLVEQNEIGSGSSYGNAGLICPSHSTPIPAPGMLTQGLKWLLDPESPFYIKPRLDPALLTWLWHFRRYCNQAALDRAIPLFRDLHRHSLQLYQEIVAAEELDCAFERRGGLMVFKTQQGLAHGKHELAEMQTHGLEMEHLDGPALRELEPTISKDVIGGLHFTEDGHVDPARFVRALAKRARALGVTILTQTEVHGFAHTDKQVTAVRTTRGAFQPQRVVITAGAWSTALMRDLRIRLLMQPAKGYSITLKAPSIRPQLPINLGEAKVAVTPMGPNLRFAGTLELAGFDFTINQRRVKAIRRAVDQYLVGIEQHNLPPNAVEIWRGMRPLPPDGLPYIGRTRAYNNLIIATGHSYLGQSMGPVTGKLVEQIVAEESPAIALDQMAVERFS